MNYKDIFTNVMAEFDDEELALIVVQIVTLNIAKKYKSRHIEKSSYTKELLNKVAKVLWGYDADKLALGIAIWEVYHIFDARMSLDGSGGCEKTTIKKLLDEKQQSATK